MFTLYQCIADSWSPQVGDPTPLGWLTTVAYLLTALLSCFALQCAPPNEDVKYRRFWTLMTLGFAFLSVNKQLDLQTLFTAAMRCVSRANGWYAERRQFQELFIIAAAAGGSLLLLSVPLYLRRTIRLVAPALVGLVLVATFVALRAASFNHEDELIGLTLPGVGKADVLELSGIALVALNATQLILRRGSRR